VLRHLPALDGIRGLGVLGILLFHAGHLRGGWLGVDLFFVLSGFLITSLLLAEHEASGSLSLLGFWGRRARRLLPALLMTLVGVSAYAAVLADPVQRPALRGDALATLFYAANWREIFVGRDYWELFVSPSPLDHTWSLAIEEQFYLAWPPLVALLLAASRGRSRSVALAAALLASASAIAMAALFDPAAGTARVYYGTDTRAFAVLTGSALAPILRSHTRAGSSVRRQQVPAAAWMIDVIVAASLAAVGWGWLSLDGREAFLYRGGLFAHALLGAIVVAAVVVADEGRAARALSAGPLRWLGLVSYGAYLWHWPVYVALSPARVPLSGVALTALRVVVTLTIAAASYRWLEMPIRRGGVRALRSPVAALVGIAATAALIALATPAPMPVIAESAWASDGRLDVLVIGDSVARSLVLGIDRVARERGLHAQTSADLGCSVLESPTIRLEDGSVILVERCSALYRKWEQWIAERRARVVVIFEGWHGQAERWIDDGWLAPCDPRFDARHAEALEALLHKVDEAGIRTAIVTAAPPAVRLLTKHRSEWRASDAELARSFRERVACLNRVREEVAARHGALVLRLTDLVCPSGRCLDDEGFAPLRPDGVHFSEASAIGAARWLFDGLAPLLAPDAAPGGA
jgi:peptidoglycan/LPS O-acetylase OafA/YrhL